jgi:cytochrome c2/cytochrome b561
MAEGRTVYAALSRTMGWLITALYFIQSCLTILLPRTDKTLPLRADYRNWHMLIGVLLMIVLIIRLRSWWRDDRGMAPPAGVRRGLFNWGRTLALATYLLLLSAPVFGFLFAWSDGVAVNLGNMITLPPLLGESYRMWMFSGYFHSGVGFMMLILAAAAAVTAAYGWLRYGTGLRSIFPPGFGVQSLLYMATTVWALFTFKSNAPGPRAVATYLAIVALIWLIGRFFKTRRTAGATPIEASGKLQLASTLGALILVGFGTYGPHAMFRVYPWPTGDVIAGPPGITSHAQPKVRVSAWAETPFERDVAAQTYKWCGFCHTYTKNGKTKAGPNLHAIFGQRVASIPNFHYSPALAAKRESGLVWDDATMDQFLAAPDAYVPGTTMVISSGPVTDPRVRRAVINMLKRDTMAGAIDLVPVPQGQ